MPRPLKGFEAFTDFCDAWLDWKMAAAPPSSLIRRCVFLSCSIASAAKAMTRGARASNSSAGNLPIFEIGGRVRFTSCHLAATALWITLWIPAFSIVQDRAARMISPSPDHLRSSTGHTQLGLPFGFPGQIPLQDCIHVDADSSREKPAAMVAQMGNLETVNRGTVRRYLQCRVGIRQEASVPHRRKCRGSVRRSAHSC